MKLNDEIICWNEQKNFYKLYQKENTFQLNKDGKILFTDTLLKIKSIDRCPIRPMIVNDKIMLFNYDKGIEIHDMKTNEKLFLNVRAVQQVVTIKDYLFLQKRKSLVVVDLKLNSILRTCCVPEFFDIVEFKGNLLFYRFKRNKTFLFDVNKNSFYELPGFYRKFTVITNVFLKDEKIIVFYGAAEDSNEQTGVYVYDLKDKKGSFDCSLSSDASANCYKYLELLDFSYNVIESKFESYDCNSNYILYLRFVLEKFGVFALLYYINEDRLSEIKDCVAGNEITRIFKYFAEKMAYYPNDDNEFLSIKKQLLNAEISLKSLFKNYKSE